MYKCHYVSDSSHCEVDLIQVLGFYDYYFSICLILVWCTGRNVCQLIKQAMLANKIETDHGRKGSRMLHLLSSTARMGVLYKYVYECACAMSARASVISVLQTLLSSGAWDETDWTIYHHETLRGIFNTHTRTDRHTHTLRIAAYILICHTRRYQRSVLVHILTEGERWGLYDDSRGKLTIGPSSQPHTHTSPVSGLQPDCEAAPSQLQQAGQPPDTIAMNSDWNWIQPSALNSFPYSFGASIKS